MIKNQNNDTLQNENIIDEVSQINEMNNDSFLQNGVSTTHRQFTKKQLEEKDLTISFNDISNYYASINDKEQDISVLTNREGILKRRKLFEIDQIDQGSTFRDINQRKDKYNYKASSDIHDENIMKEDTSKKLISSKSETDINSAKSYIQQKEQTSLEIIGSKKIQPNRTTDQSAKPQKDVDYKESDSENESDDDNSDSNSDSNSENTQKNKSQQKKKKKKKKDDISENTDEMSAQRYITESQYQISNFTDRTKKKLDLPGIGSQQNKPGFPIFQKEYKSSLEQKTSFVEIKKRKNFLNVLFFITKFKRRMRSKINLKQYLSLKYWHFKLIGDASHYLKSENDEQTEHITKLFSKIQTFSPTSFVVVIWHLIILVILLIQLFFIPMKAGFMLHLDSGFWMYFLRILPSIAFCIEILLKFNTGYYEEGQIVMDRQKIISAYLKWKFWIDLTATSSILANQKYDSQWLDFIQFLHIQQMTNLIDFLDDHFQISQRFQTLFELVKLIFLIVVIAHFCGCAFHFLAQVEMQQGEVETWLQAKVLVDESWQVRYLNSLYWAIITMNTVGYGDVIPITSIEKIYVCIITVVCCGVFGYAINTIGSIVREIALKEAAYKQIKFDISMYMRNRNISREVQLKVFKFLEYQNQQELEGTHKASQILEKVPDSVQNEVYMEFYGKILSQCKLFRFNFSEKFINTLSLKMKESTFAPGEILFKQGEQDSRIIFMLKGEAQIFVTQRINEDFEKRFTLIKISAGSFFGHSEFFTNQLRQFSCQAVTTCNMVSLTNQDVISIIKEYQKDYENFCKLRDNLVLYGNQIDQKCQSCHQFTHSLLECPLINVSLDNDFILKKNNFNVVHKERTPFKRNDYKFRTLQENQDVRYLQRKVRIDLVMDQRPNYQDNFEDCLFETDQEFLLKTPAIQLNYWFDGIQIDILSEESDDEDNDLDKDLEEVRSNLQNIPILQNQYNEYSQMNSLKSNSQIKNAIPNQMGNLAINSNGSSNNNNNVNITGNINSITNTNNVNNTNYAVTPNSKNLSHQQTESTLISKQPTIGNSNTSGRRLTRQQSIMLQQQKQMQQIREQSGSFQQQQQQQSQQQQSQSQRSITSITDLQLQPQINSGIGQQFSQQHIAQQQYSQQLINLSGLTQNINQIYLGGNPPLIPQSQVQPILNTHHNGGSGIVSFQASISDKVSFGSHNNRQQQQNSNLLTIDQNDIYQPSLVSKKSQQQKNIIQEDNKSVVSSRSGRSAQKKCLDKQDSFNRQQDDIQMKKGIFNTIKESLSIDIRKDYENYFPHNNLAQILDKIKKKAEFKLLGNLNIAMNIGNLQMRKTNKMNNSSNLKLVRSSSRINERNVSKLNRSFSSLPREANQMPRESHNIPIQSPSKFKDTTQNQYSNLII